MVLVLALLLVFALAVILGLFLVLLHVRSSRFWFGLHLLLRLRSLLFVVLRLFFGFLILLLPVCMHRVVSVLGLILAFVLVYARVLDCKWIGARKSTRRDTESGIYVEKRLYFRVFFDSSSSIYFCVHVPFLYI